MPGRSDPLACLPDGITSTEKVEGKNIKQRKERRKYQQNVAGLSWTIKKTEHVTTDSDLSIT